MSDPIVATGHGNQSSMISDIQARMCKRATFEAAVAELTTVLLRHARQQRMSHGDTPTATATDQHEWDAVSRCAMLLRTRYTSPAFWRAGRFLFLAAAAVAHTSQHKAAAVGYLKACEGHLAEHDAESEAAPAEESSSATSQGRPDFLFEGQLSEGSDIPLNPALHMQHLFSSFLAGDGLPSEATAAESAPPTAGQPSGQQMEVLLQQFREAFGDASSEDLAAALQASLEENDGGSSGHRAPPASQAVVAGLKREDLTTSRLADLGGQDAECSICRETLAVGSSVQVMPCSDGHVFHVPCLAPWLQNHNSCPVCRHELPTDDDRYERDKIYEAGTKGAEAALSHNEFMYT